MSNKYKGIRVTDILFVVVIIMAFLIGSYILTATFFGIITLIGLVVLIESIGPLKWLASRSTKVIDVILFVFTILATMNYGLNISASLTIAGIGYTLVYAPRLREQLKAHRNKSKAKAKSNNYKHNINFK